MCAPLPSGSDRSYALVYDYRRLQVTDFREAKNRDRFAPSVGRLESGEVGGKNIAKTAHHHHHLCRRLPSSLLVYLASIGFSLCC